MLDEGRNWRQDLAEHNTMVEPTRLLVWPVLGLGREARLQVLPVTGRNSSVVMPVPLPPAISTPVGKITL